MMIHFFKDEVDGKRAKAACGVVREKGRITENPKNVTCPACLRSRFFGGAYAFYLKNIRPQPSIESAFTYVMTMLLRDPGKIKRLLAGNENMALYKKTLLKMVHAEEVADLEVFGVAWAIKEAEEKENAMS